MADFEISPEDLSSSKSITERIGSNFYPNGNVVIKNTTLSKLPLKDRSLRSADPIRILQGDGIYRNPALVTAAYMQNTQSALHGTLAARADIGDIKVADPNDPTGKKLLTGAEARNEIMKRSILTTGLAPNGIEESVAALNRSVVNSAGGDGESSTTITNPDGSSYSHSSSNYSSSDGMPVLNGANRDIAVADLLSPEEKEIYENKINELKKKVNFNGGAFGTFNLNLSELSSYSFDIKNSGTHFGGQYRQSQKVSDQYKSLGSKTCFVAASLIELLLQLTNKIYISGGQGTDRGLVSAQFTKLSPENDNNILSDHSFGRGFDISSIGHKKESAIQLGTRDVTRYREALDIFLTALQTIPHELHPDSIIIHSQLKSEMEITDSIESPNAAIRAKYPRSFSLYKLLCKYCS
jgi:hypothetical protein